ncbi:MAG TPA: cytochrome c peroxidase, partial [Candidatus Binataceae bacterium]|nr:cytochrome c peroxidase [Candidatus Binataceae bacterium]
AGALVPVTSGGRGSPHDRYRLRMNRVRFSGRRKVCVTAARTARHEPITGANMIRGRIWIGLILIVAATGISALIASAQEPGPLADPKSQSQVGFPAELYSWVIPADNPQTPAKIALGKQLFFEDGLSGDGKVSCDQCHGPAKGFTDQLPTSMGIHGQFGQRNAPTILNALFSTTQFWDGRAATLEDQAKQPILNPIEMGVKSPQEAVAKIKAIPGYSDQFLKVFGHDVNYDDMARAIASYERTQIAFDTPFDHYMAGDQSAIGDDAKRGWSIFNGKGRCMSCHGWNPTQPLFSEFKFHNIGVSAHKSDFVPLARKALALLASGSTPLDIDKLAIQTDMSGLGRFLVTKQPHDIGSFRTMGLRNLLVTQPYFHDGSQPTLWDTLDHYNKGGVQNPYLDGGIVPLGLSESEEDDLVAFLATLTSPEYEAMAKEEYDAQFKRSRTDRPQRDTEAAMGLKGRNGPGLGGPFGDIGPDQDQMGENPALLGGD